MPTASAKRVKKTQDLLTRIDVSRLLGVSHTTVLTLERRGDLPVVRIGKMVRYRREDVEAFIEDNYYE